MINFGLIMTLGIEVDMVASSFNIIMIIVIVVVGYLINKVDVL